MSMKNKVVIKCLALRDEIAVISFLALFCIKTFDDNFTPTVWQIGIRDLDCAALNCPGKYMLIVNFYLMPENLEYITRPP